MTALRGPRSVRFLSVAFAAVVTLGLGPITPAQAEAVVERGSFSKTSSFTATDFCFPEDLIGQATLMESGTWQAVETPGGVVTVHGVNDFEWQIVFPDGRYVRSGLNRDVFAFVDSPGSTIFTRVTQDFRTVYAADGTPIGTVMVHAVFHYTMRDGELSTLVEQFHVRCP